MAKEVITMTFGERLRQARLAKGLTQKQLAEKIGAKHNSVSDWENDKNKPGPDAIELICGVLQISPNYLLRSLKGKMIDDEALFNISNILPMPKMKKVPLLGDIACGEPILALENFEDYVHVDEDVDCDFALMCKGDSMINARIFDGDIVYIHQQPAVDNGEIAAVCIDDEATLKRVYKHPEYLELRAENPLYKPLIYRGEELEGIRILGKAVWFKSRVR